MAFSRSQLKLEMLPVMRPPLPHPLERLRERMLMANRYFGRVALPELQSG
jgi:hypothetical protein